ncbi:MAG TPA: M1 family aminopeptidase [Gemmatimonadales bacterium]|nr:M1 family aminopeptidase [Gemmatimonadales bacterium]
MRWRGNGAGAALALLLAASAPLSAQTPRALPAAHSGADELMGPGISHALAERRARAIADVRYDLALDVTALDSAVGRVTVRFRRVDANANAGPAADRAVILDFRGRRLTSATANGQPLPPGAANGAHIRVPARLLVPDANVLEFGFVADIAPSGAPIIRNHDATDGSDYLYTLLVPADANQLFPCFDQPDLKGRVRLTLTAPAAWSVVANGSAAAADSAAGRAVVTTRFDETLPISTYLIAFAAGPWHRATSVHRGRTIHAYVRRSRAREADLDTLLAQNQRALDWLERYFGRRFPFEKFDFVLAPAFPFGGMEHPGAVFYNEDRFIFRERPTLPRRLARFATVLHECAHQWFGDLVTMRWFDDLWLKEGFATFMATKALADLDPAADAWKTFYLGNKPPAYAVDETRGTRPLWQSLDNLDQAKSNYGAIVYNKAPSVLAQLEYLVGGEAFRTGVRRFLAQHAYANATWQELLGAIGRAARRPLDEFGKNFMLRPGMPVVEQRLEMRGGRIERLTLVQHPAQALSGPAPWTERTDVILVYRGRPTLRMPVELKGHLTEVTAARGHAAPLFVFANARDHGYFLLLLDSASVRALEGGALGDVHDAFLRAMLWGALWNQVRAGRMAPERFVRMALREFPRERDEQIAPFVLARLGRAVSAYLTGDERARVQPEVERVLWRGAGNRASAYGVRKADLDAFIDLATTPEAVARLDTIFAADSAAGAPVKDPTRWDVVTRLLELGAPEADSRLTAEQARDTTPDGRRRAFIAGAGRPSAEVKREYFTRYFADSTLNEAWASGSLGPFNAIEHQALTLPYLRPALDSLPFIQTHRRIFFLESWIAAFLGGQTGEPALDAVHGYLADTPDLADDLRRKVLQYEDELARTVRLRGQTGAPTPPAPTTPRSAASPRPY